MFRHGRGSFGFPLLICLILTFVSQVHSQTVVNVLPATNGAWGVEYHDGFLWVGDDMDGFIRKVDPATGAVISLLPTPYDENHISYGANHGVSWDGSGFWVAGDYGKDWLYKVAVDGTFLDTLATPADAIGGLSFDGTYLLVSRYYPNSEADILQIDTSDGSVVGAPIPTQGQQPFGVVYNFDDMTLWNNQDDNDGDPETVWHLNYPDGSVIDQFDSPAASPKGMAIGGGYMWLVANTIGGSGRKIYQIDLGGGGTGDILALPAERDFNIVPLGTPHSYQQTFRNVGDGPLVVSNIYTTGAFDMETVSLPQTLAPMEAIIFDVTFSPPVPGVYAGSVTAISDDFDEGTLIVPLTGIAVPPEPTLDVSPDDLNFADTGCRMVRDMELVLQNDGYEELVISAITSDDPCFEVPALTMPISLAALEVISISIVFAPDVSISYNSLLHIESNDPARSDFTVNLSGTGIWKTWEPGEIVWWAQGIENVVCVMPIPDLGDDGAAEVVAESYDAGADGDPLTAFRGNSDGAGVPIWSTGDGPSGGYGDLCLGIIGDLDDDGYAELLRGTAWGGRKIEVRGSEDGELLWDYDTYANDGGGWVYTVAAIPDLSGDGKPEVLAGAGTSNGSYTGARRIYCFDGATGAIRFVYLAPEAFNCVIATSDLNNDDIPDVVGGNADGYVYCVSGASMGTGTLLWSFNTGENAAFVDEIEDVSGDGIADVIVGSWSSQVFCLNGVTGGEVWSSGIGDFVLQARVIDDVSGDGISDVAVCNFGNSFRVISGKDGALYWFVSTGANVWSVYPIPDVDGDGITDVLAGAQNDLVYCVSGASDDVVGDVIWTADVGALVFSVRAIDDVNNNGTPDVIAGTQYLNGVGGRIVCLDGGRPLASVDPDLSADCTELRLLGAYPNPTTSSSTLMFQVPEGLSGQMSIDIFDLTGRRIRSLSRKAVPGLNRMSWDGCEQSGLRAASGIYFYQLRDKTEKVSRQGRIILER